MRKIKSINILLAAIMACTFSDQISYASSRAQYAMTGVAAGATAGAGAGALVSSNAIIPGAIIGGGIGGIMGMSAYGNGLEKGRLSVVNLPGETIIVIPSDNLFEMNTANFIPNSTDILDDAQDLMNKQSDQDVHICAHTDPIGANISFQGAPLSEQQATKVAGYFWTNGLKLHDLNRNVTYCGCDDNDSIASNQRLDGMTANRRIQITLTPHQQKVIPPQSQDNALIPLQHKLIIPKKYSK